MPLWLTLILSVTASIVVGLLMERLAYRPLRTAGEEATLISSLAVSTILQNLMTMAFSAQRQAFKLPDWLTAIHMIGPFRLSTINILTFVVTIVALIALSFVIRKTKIGIAIVNGHDGNIAPIEIASRKIKEKYPEARIVSMDRWWVAAGQLLPEGTFEVMNGEGHAGEGESSIAYYLYPQWNEPELAKGYVPDKLPKFSEVKWDFSELTNSAATGDPTKATVEKGRMMTEVLVDCMEREIKALDAINWDYRTTGI